MPGLLCWLLLVILAVPAALGQSEGSPAGGATLVEDDSLGSYVAPVTEAPIEFEPAPADPVASLPVDPVPADPAPVASPEATAPAEPVPPSTDPGPVGEVPPPADPVEETPVEETPVDEIPVDEIPLDPVGSVINNSPTQPGPIEAPVLQQPADHPPLQVATGSAQILRSEELRRRLETPVAPAFAPTPVAPRIAVAVPPVARAPATSGAEAISAVAAPVASQPMPPTSRAPGVPTDKQFSPGLGVLERPVAPGSATVAATPKPAQTPGVAGPGAPAEVNPLQPKLTSPTGPPPKGSQLLGVLAQYVIAGGSGPPKSVALLVLVTIATVVVAFSLRTPRSMFHSILGVPDRRCAGYRAVSLRPG